MNNQLNMRNNGAMEELPRPNIFPINITFLERCSIMDGTYSFNTEECETEQYSKKRTRQHQWSIYHDGYKLATLTLRYTGYIPSQVTIELRDAEYRNIVLSHTVVIVKALDKEQQVDLFGAVIKWWIHRNDHTDQLSDQDTSVVTAEFEREVDTTILTTSIVITDYSNKGFVFTPNVPCVTADHEEVWLVSSYPNMLCIGTVRVSSDELRVTAAAKVTITGPSNSYHLDDKVELFRCHCHDHRVLFKEVINMIQNSISELDKRAREVIDKENDSNEPYVKVSNIGIDADNIPFCIVEVNTDGVRCCTSDIEYIPQYIKHATMKFRIERSVTDLYLTPKILTINHHPTTIGTEELTKRITPVESNKNINTGLSLAIANMEACVETIISTWEDNYKDLLKQIKLIGTGKSKSKTI